MTNEDVLSEFEQSGALLSGHFILSSGLHSDRYLQCARVLMHPKRAERLARALAEKVRALNVGPIDLVVSPAMGGVIIGYEVARCFEVPAIFLERVEGRFTLRRGFDIKEGVRCLMVEDVITTGLSSLECMEEIVEEGGVVVAAACLVERSRERQDLGVPVAALAEFSFPAWAQDQLPPHLLALPAVKPGSRGLK